MQGTYPSRYKDGVEPAEDKSYEPFLGEVNLFAGNFAPRGWAYCDGQILQISQHDALFSLLGTRYGGDGRTTFGLPDLRGRVPVHPGSGPGLMPWQWGQKYGGEDSSLSVGQLPAHIHTANVPEPSTLVLGASALLALALIGWRRRRQS
ncbi:MAG: phage tail protein [Candidatus Nealsonbacteria bacterium]|nr:phage tail protein [Candidatus Nealsonbacteria bacterium]